MTLVPKTFVRRSKGVTTIAQDRFPTNCWVASTMRSGYENGYQVITLTDGVSATSPGEQDNASMYGYPMFSTPMLSTDLIDRLGS